MIACYRLRLFRFTTTYHYPHSHAVVFAGEDEASGVVTAHAELAIDGETVWIGLRYNDEYVREEGRWRFKARRQEFVYVLPLSELPTGLGDRLRRRWPGTEPAPVELPDGLETYRRFFEDERGQRKRCGRRLDADGRTHRSSADRVEQAQTVSLPPLHG